MKSTININRTVHIGSERTNADIATRENHKLKGDINIESKISVNNRLVALRNLDIYFLKFKTPIIPETKFDSLYKSIAFSC